jgi:hypothetical protein
VPHGDAATSKLICDRGTTLVDGGGESGSNRPP